MATEAPSEVLSGFAAAADRLDVFDFAAVRRKLAIGPRTSRFLTSGARTCTSPRYCGEALWR